MKRFAESVASRRLLLPRAGMCAWLRVALLLPSVGLMAACEVDEHCDPGYVYTQGYCSPPLTQPPVSDAGADEDVTSAMDTPKDTFGKTCANNSDCAGGNAPFCAPAPFSICTQQNCMAGEAHAGACPSDWMCLAIPANPSTCVKL
jgi:hypothetical protein